MADTSVVTDNGDQPQPVVDRQLSLPESIAMTAAEMSRVPAPGTQRALKAETGKTFDDMVGPDADSADRYQTFIWTKLRRQFPGLRWAECDGVEIEIDQDSVAGVTALDPTRVTSITSPASADSGD